MPHGRRPPSPPLAAAGLLAALLMPPVPPAAVAQADEPPPEAFEARVRDYLLAHPEVVVEALERYRAGRREVLRAVETNPVIARSASLFDDEDDPWLGNPEGDVTLVAFVDYARDDCRRMAPALAGLLERDPGLRLVFKPLPGPPGDGAYLAALAALAARAQGRFAALHEALMNLPSGRRPEEGEVFRVAAHVGLDLDRLRRDMGDPALGAQLERNERLAGALGIAGAPAVVVGTEIAEGVRDPAALEILVARARLP